MTLLFKVLIFMHFIPFSSHDSIMTQIHVSQRSFSLRLWITSTSTVWEMGHLISAT